MDQIFKKVSNTLLRRGLESKLNQIKCKRKVGRTKNDKFVMGSGALNYEWHIFSVKTLFIILLSFLFWLLLMMMTTMAMMIISITLYTSDLFTFVSGSIHEQNDKSKYYSLWKGHDPWVWEELMETSTCRNVFLQRRLVQGLLRPSRMMLRPETTHDTNQRNSATAIHLPWMTMKSINSM